MAIYHFHVTQVSRGKGQSAIAAAAYRAGERLQNKYYGEYADYTAKGGVIFTEIMAPDYVPELLLDRETLWNEVEAVEKHPKAQLAYSFDFVLMNEFSIEENVELARRFIKDNFIAKGMIADIAVHRPDKKEVDNPHVHVLCPIRPINDDGTWGEKQRREYLFDEEHKPVLDKNGHQKFNAVPTTDWGRPETLEAWRIAWADMVNSEFEKKGLADRIDNRSYEKQGILLIPQIHEGPNVRKMEAKGIRTEKGSLNRLIKEINQGILVLKEKLKDIVSAIAELSEELSEASVSKESYLSKCLQKYFNDRNAKAASFAYGKKKAEITNLKQLAELLVYLEKHNISTVPELEKYVLEMSGKLRKLGEMNRKKKSEVTKIKENLRYLNWYKEGIPVVDEIIKQKFNKGKERIKAENSDTLRRYHIAKRILTERGLIDNTNTQSMKQRLHMLEMETENDYGQYKELAKEVKLLRNICAISQKEQMNTRQKKREENSL